MTGMEQRRKTAPEQATSDLAHKASLMAIENAKIQASEIELIIVATITPDHPFPSTACILHNLLGLKSAPAFDISAGCTGFIYASDMARAYIESGKYKKVLVVGADNLTKITNYQDRNTCILFGDGAGAAIYSAKSVCDASIFVDSSLEADGKNGELLIQHAGGSRLPATQETVKDNKHTVEMQGNKIFKLAIKSMYNVCIKLCKRNNIVLNDIDWLVPHQANMRIITKLGKKMRLPDSKVIVNVEKYGNTSAATCPIAFSEALQNSKIKKGDLVMMTSFGAGLTSGAMLLRV